MCVCVEQEKMNATIGGMTTPSVRSGFSSVSPFSRLPYFRTSFNNFNRNYYKINSPNGRSSSCSFNHYKPSSLSSSFPRPSLLSMAFSTQAPAQVSLSLSLCIYIYMYLIGVKEKSVIQFALLV